jgi:5-methylcytosine-specific restriction endonuclease McrBC regulatory subunit McrC
MVLDRYEYSKIANAKLPSSWQSQMALDELTDFLQQNWEQRSVFYEDGEVKSQQQFLDFVGSGGIRTKKYIGTVVFKGEQLNIYPRVFSTEKDDHETDDLTQKHMLYNLVKWIEYCNKLEYPFINISSELNDAEDLKELFITLYIGYVRSALERSLYYQYVEETEDCTSIKGKFDLKDYLVTKIPNGQADKFKCTYSNFEFDNRVNRIIKYTCKQLINITSKRNQKTLRTILTRLNEVSDVKCTPNDCNNIRLSKMHRNYGIIISMSKMFLLNKMSNYSIDTNESFCFLFPTDVLFEGFIGGFMKEVLRDIGGKVRLQESRMSLVEKIIYKGETSGAAFTMRHDILVELQGKVFVLDTKYKEMTRFEDNPEYRDTISTEAKQGDLYQVLEYARKRDIADVYLLYPMYRYEEKEKEFPVAVSESPSGDINVHFIRLPFIFEEENEERTRQQLADVILSVFEIDKNI